MYRDLKKWCTSITPLKKLIRIYESWFSKALHNFKQNCKYALGAVILMLVLPVTCSVFAFIMCNFTGMAIAHIIIALGITFLCVDSLFKESIYDCLEPLFGTILFYVMMALLVAFVQHS